MLVLKRTKTDFVVFNKIPYSNFKGKNSKNYNEF